MGRNILIGFIAFLLLGCTRDDICAEDTVTTPLVVITFKDRTSPLTDKNVSGLQIETNSTDPILVFSATEAVNTVSIPLDTGNDTASFRFIRNAGDDDDENVDIITLSYLRESSYVNRACSFKTTYSDLNAIRANEGIDNWIFSITVVKSTVEDETEAHITILH